MVRQAAALPAYMYRDGIDVISQEMRDSEDLSMLYHKVCDAALMHLARFYIVDEKRTASEQG
jgi:hypothetical protein